MFFFAWREVLEFLHVRDDRFFLDFILFLLALFGARWLIYGKNPPKDGGQAGEVLERKWINSLKSLFQQSWPSDMIQHTIERPNL